MRTKLRNTLLMMISLLFASTIQAGTGSGDQTQFPPTYSPSGEHLYQQYCAACHGADAKGHGPAAGMLRKPPPDLTTLSKRHGGSFPYQYVSDVLVFGPGVAAHGSSDMPTWGPIFLSLEKQNEAAVRQRIKKLSDYLASVQGK